MSIFWKILKLSLILISSIFEKPSGQHLDLICDESLTCWGLNSNLGHFDSFTFILISCGESCLLVLWCAGSKCDMVGSDKDRGRSRRPGADDRGWSITGQVLGGRVIGRPDDAMSGLYHAMEMRSVGFLVWPQNPDQHFHGFGLKTGSSGLVV
jgi:hypothetical protein